MTKVKKNINLPRETNRNMIPQKRIVYIFLCLILFLNGCGIDCDNEIRQTVVSTSKKLKAVVFSRDCGALTGVNTQVSILPTGKDLPHEAGNTFVVDGYMQLELRWYGDTRLDISGIDTVEPVKQLSEVAGIKVTYSGTLSHPKEH